MLVYGIDGIKQKNYRVYIGDSIDTNKDGWVDYICEHLATFQYGEAKIRLDYILSAITHFGECRKDSIVSTIENGDSIEGNEVGTIVIDKSASFAAELINATAENINSLHNDWQGKKCYVILEEIEGRTKKWSDGNSGTVESIDTHEIIVLGNSIAGSPLNVSDNITGSDIARATISMSDNVASVGDFRLRFEMPYDLANQE